MGVLSFISELIIGIGVFLLLGQAFGYLTSSIGVLGYLLSGALIVIGFIMFSKFSEKDDETTAS